MTTLTHKNITDENFRVCLMGASLTTGNMGVSALAASLFNLIRQTRPDAEISLFIGERTNEPQILNLPDGTERIQVINYRLAPKALLQRHLLWVFALAVLHRALPFRWVRNLIQRNPCINTLMESDFVGNIHGGDSFSDIYGGMNFVLGCIPDLIILLLGKELVLLPQTYGPYTSKIAQRIAKSIITNSSLALSRDSEGLLVVRNLTKATVGAKQPVFCPDVAFSLAAMRPSDPMITPPLSNGPIIGLNVSGLLYNGGFTKDNMFALKFDYKEFVHALAEQLLKSTDAHLLLVPHTFAHDGHVESDPEACRALMKALVELYPTRVHLVAKEYDQSEIKGIIGQCDMFIGSRMHACIAALSQGIPTIGVAYSRKFKGVFESIGVGEMVVDARTTGSEDAIRTIISGYKQRMTIAPLLQEKVQTAKRLLQETFRTVLQ